ncbi:major capsid protein, partial [Rheinheimera sp.]
MARMWSRSTRWDFYWPALAHIGEQAVLNQEIYTQGTTADQEVFGYQERFAEYRYKPSTITGHFRSASPLSLDAWHLAQDFGTLPLLNSTFIEDNPPFARVIATPGEPDFLLDCYFKLKCARPMPVYSVPGLVDHF